jgi:hypothetical protein
MLIIGDKFITADDACFWIHAIHDDALSRVANSPRVPLFFSSTWSMTENLTVPIWHKRFAANDALPFFSPLPY